MTYCKIEVAIPADWNAYFENNATIPNSKNPYRKAALLLTNAPTG